MCPPVDTLHQGRGLTLGCDQPSLGHLWPMVLFISALEIEVQVVELCVWEIRKPFLLSLWRSFDYVIILTKMESLAISHRHNFIPAHSEYIFSRSLHLKPTSLLKWLIQNQLPITKDKYIINVRVGRDLGNHCPVPTIYRW